MGVLAVYLSRLPYEGLLSMVFVPVVAADVAAAVMAALYAALAATAAAA